MIPDWAPNIHPLIVHFPIALLFAAVAVDVAALFVRNRPGLRTAAAALYAAGAVGAIVSYITGNRAAESVEIPTAAIAAVNDHQDLALYLMLFSIFYGAVRVGLIVALPDLRVAWQSVLTLVAVAGLYLVWQTAESGARLVFEHGVGVQAVAEMAGELDMIREAEAARRVADAEPVIDDRGGWTWRIAPGASEALGEAFVFVEGEPDRLHAEVRESDDGRILALSPSGDGAFMFVTGEDIASIGMEAVIDASNFDGTVALVHNVRDARNYHYFRVGQRLEQGRVVDGRDEVMEAGERRTSDWTTLRATGDRGHFYSYEDGRAVAHGHSATPPAGRTGLRIEGTGEVLLRRMEVQVVR
jgi:uncharacterized membrane protein